MKELVISLLILGPVAVSQQMTVDELEKELESESTVLIDVRLASDFDHDPSVIAQAKWRDPERVDEWSKELPKDKEIVVYCVHGHRVSKGAAARLRELGFDAKILEGGIEGWKESGGEVVPAKR